MAIRTDRGIPVPPKHRSAANGKYPFQTMKVGESFLVPLASENRVRSGMAYYHSTKKLRFTARRMQNGIRVWRVK